MLSKIKKLLKIFKPKSMELLFVIPGWYESNQTLQSEKKTVIRVLGGSEKRKNMFVLADGREMHEFEILNNYTYMVTSPTENNNDMFDDIDFGDISDNVDITETTTESTLTPTIVTNTVSSNTPDTLNIPNTPIIKQEISNPPTPNIKPVSEEDIFVNQLLNNIKLPEYDKQNLNLTVPFTFNYNLDKLKSLLNTLNCDVNKKNKFIEKILEDNISNIHTLIKQSLLEYLTIQIPVETIKTEANQIEEVTENVNIENDIVTSEEDDMEIYDEINNESQPINKYLVNYFS